MYPDKESLFETTLTETSKSYLLETARWTKFLAVLTFIFSGLLAVGLLLMIVGGEAASMTQSFAAMGLVGGIIFCVIMLIIYLYPAIMMYRFSTLIKGGLLTNDQQMVDHAFRCQRNLFRFTGILIIVLILFYVLIFGAAMVFSA